MHEVEAEPVPVLLGCNVMGLMDMQQGVQNESALTEAGVLATVTQSQAKKCCQGTREKREHKEPNTTQWSQY